MMRALSQTIMSLCISPSRIDVSVRSMIENSTISKDKGKGKQSVHLDPVASPRLSLMASSSQIPTSDVGRGPPVPFSPKGPVTILRSPTRTDSIEQLSDNLNPNISTPVVRNHHVLPTPFLI